MLVGLGAVAITAGVASAAEKINETAPASAHAGHSADMGPHKNQALIDAADDCSKKGSLCINHCLMSFAAKDTTLAVCAKSVTEVIAICNALVTVAAVESRNLSALARAAMSFCKDCEDECRKHEKTHATCKECADACAKCLVECKKLAA
jgi:Cys-rich four helix bundle protein (predicted Tat secretion target)